MFRNNDFINSAKPKCIIANTIKGKSVPFMENVSKWHFRSPSDNEFNEAVSSIESFYRDSFNRELLKIADQNSDVFLLTADIGFQVFDEFRSKFTDRFLNMGVAEANMIGVASGMTLNNKIPICYTIIPFLIMRAFEQIRTDVCIQNLPVKLVGVGVEYLMEHLVQPTIRW